jgi:hypothetical protein
LTSLTSFLYWFADHSPKTEKYPNRKIAASIVKNKNASRRRLGPWRLHSGIFSKRFLMAFSRKFVSSWIVNGQ